MTNNTDIQTLITFLENQMAMRQANIDKRKKFIADPENRQYIEDPTAFTLEIAELVASHAGMNIALQEAKAIAEGYADAPLSLRPTN